MPTFPPRRKTAQCAKPHKNARGLVTKSSEANLPRLQGAVVLEQRDPLADRLAPEVRPEACAKRRHHSAAGAQSERMRRLVGTLISDPLGRGGVLGHYISPAEPCNASGLDSGQGPSRREARGSL